MSAPSLQIRRSFSPEREACRRALERRFGWLVPELERVNGNLSRLPLHLQTLWCGRAKVVLRFNRIGRERDWAKRARAYARLARELTR